MKKILISIVFGLMAVISLCAKNDLHIHAADVAEFGVRVTPVLEGKTINNLTYVGKNVPDNAPRVEKVYIPENSVMVTITLTNNPGYIDGGMGVKYPTELLKPITGKNDKIVCEIGAAGNGVSISVSDNKEEGIAGLAFIGADVEEDDGDIITFYFERTSQGEIFPLTSMDFHLEVNQFQGPKTPENPDGDIPYTTPPDDKKWVGKVYRLMLGDIDGDRQITAEDAQLVLALLKENGDMAVTLTEIKLANGFNYSALYITLRVNGQEVEFLALGIADVNGDGIVDQDDAEELLDYYLAIITNNTPSNPNIGTWQDIVVWVYV